MVINLSSPVFISKKKGKLSRGQIRRLSRRWMASALVGRVVRAENCFKPELNILS